MKKYDPASIESKWQQIWDETKLYAADDADPTRPKYYFLVEFPYPSGDGLHVGHVRSYTALDIMARHKRMQGYNVLYPIGYDEFGLPTENYAIRNKIAPQVATARNVATFERQLRSLGLGFDWDRQIHTSDPSYYKWTQVIFGLLYKAGLAYQAELAINWCPHCKTGLANEEVVDGRHERCGTPVEKKLLKQWLLKITAYADRLIEDLKTVDYLDRIATQQINWIGRSTGAEVMFKLEGLNTADTSVTVYTTRPDTLLGATFLVVSPEVARSWETDGWKAPADVRKYVDSALKATELSRQEDTKSKTGVDTRILATHPISGDQIPVWVADYVLGSYGTGAIMAVPAHDQRDHDFARTFDLPIKPVIEPVTGHPADNEHQKTSVVAVVRNPKTGETLLLDWGPRRHNWGGMMFVGGGVEVGEDFVEAAKREIAEETGYTDVEFVRQAEVPVNNHYYSNVKDRNDNARMYGLLFDLSSEEQIPTQLDDGETDKFSLVWVPDNEVTMYVSDDGHKAVYDLLSGTVATAGYGIVTGSGVFDGMTSVEAKKAITTWLEDNDAGRGSTKYKLRDWVFSRQHYWGEPIPIIHCDTDGPVLVPDDQLPVTLPTVESYEPTDTGESPLAAMTDWVETTCPKCGGPAKRETDTMPNWAGSSWYYLRYTDPHNDQAFAAADKLAYWTPVDLYNGGMEHTTLHLLYSRFWHKFLFDQGLVPTSEPYARRRSHGMILGPDGRKMSKSIGNVINPDLVIERYGADAIRLYEMFMGPFDEQTVWSDEHLNGVSRFIYRTWHWANDMMSPDFVLEGSTGYEQATGTFETEVDRATHKTIKKVHEDIQSMHFNTAVSALMTHVNFLTTSSTKDRLRQENTLALRARTLRTLILLLAPFTPHLAEELWQDLGEKGSVHLAGWPKYDPEIIKDDFVTIVVQVNGKVRGNLFAPVGLSDSELAEMAVADPNVARHLEGKETLRTVVVPRKLVNFVVR